MAGTISVKRPLHHREAFTTWLTTFVTRLYMLRSQKASSLHAPDMETVLMHVCVGVLAYICVCLCDAGAIAKLAKEDPRRARTGQVLDDRIAAKRSELRKGGKKKPGTAAGVDVSTSTVPASREPSAYSIRSINILTQIVVLYCGVVRKLRVTIKSAYTASV